MSSPSSQAGPPVECHNKQKTNLEGCLRVDRSVIRQGQPAEGEVFLKSFRTLPVKVEAKCVTFHEYLSVHGLGDDEKPASVRRWRGVAYPKGGQFMQRPTFAATPKGLEFRSPETVTVTFDCSDGWFPHEFYQTNPSEREMLDSSYWRDKSDCVQVSLQLEVKP